MILKSVKKNENAMDIDWDDNENDQLDDNEIDQLLQYTFNKRTNNNTEPHDPNYNPFSGAPTEEEKCILFTNRIKK